jgi:hypothetical protein
MQQLRDQVTSSSPAATDTMLTAALEEERRQRLALAEQVTSLQQKVASLMVRLDARTPTADVLQAPQQATNAHADGCACAAGQAMVVPTVPRAHAHEPMKPAIDPEQREALVGECDVVIAQFAHVPALRDAIQQRDELQREYDTLKATKTEFRTSVRVGKALQVAREVTAKHSLTEDDYLTLGDKYDALVQKLMITCEVLLANDDLDALDTLSSKLEELQALDLSALPRSWANDPVQPPAPPAPGATAEEEEEEWAYDPVYMPPHTDEIILA